MTMRFAVDELLTFAHQLLLSHGLAEEHAKVTADMLVEADLLGYKTHGLDLLPIYLEALGQGEMAKEGSPAVLADTGANVLWDGLFLPGQSLICRAMDMALERVVDHGIVTVVVRHSQHTGCHAAYLRRATDRGAMVLLTAANSVGRRIAPFGAVTPVFSPSPFAVGIPSGGAPILLDMTMASTANSVCRQHHQRGAKLPHPWLLSATGQVSDDPAMLYEAGGTILPLGGQDNGHKGFGLILMLEALTLALSGGGHHASQDEPPSQSVFLQIIDPAAFGGSRSFTTEIDWIIEASHMAEPVPGGSRPHIPGERALARREQQRRKGVEVADDVRLRLQACTTPTGPRWPNPLP